MSVFGELEKTYYELDGYLATLEFEASSRGHNRKEARYASLREKNDQAYFLYFFTRLEDHINEESDRAIEYGLGLSTWRRRSPWRELKELSHRSRLPFMSRVALLVDPSTNPYGLVRTHYASRNAIAHGGSARISMPTVVSEMKLLYHILRFQ